MAKIKLFRNGSYLNRFEVNVPDEPDAETLYVIYKHKGGLRNFVRFVLAFIREQSDEYDVCDDAEGDDTPGVD